MASVRPEPESARGSDRRIRVLFLGANPRFTEQLRIDQELREIQERVQASAHGGSFDINVRLAVRFADLRRALLAFKPDVVHFSGHGTEKHEILLEDERGFEEPVDKETLAGLFGVLKDRLRMVILNACYGRGLAEVIARHVDCAIGAEDRIPDGAAIEFAGVFYEAIGFNRPALDAFNLGVGALKRLGVPDTSLPQLVVREGVNAREVVLGYGAPPPPDSNPSPLGRLVHVPELPPNFLLREDELTRLKELVLGASGKAVGLTSRTRRAGVHGMGGIGKSVLAACLAWDNEVRRTFVDGVFWVTLGRDPKLPLLQADLCASLSDRGAAFENESQGAARLTELYGDQACLVILDDVWSPRHAAAFGALGPRGRMLLTTRDLELLVTLGADLVTLDVLPVDQALALLASWSGQAVLDLPVEALEVAKECGYLPLALAMIGAMTKGRPDRWGDALEDLRAADLEAIGREFPEYPYPDLLCAIEVSLKDLKPGERERYLDFAVFGEDRPVPEAVLATLWRADGLDARRARALVYRFMDRSLLTRVEGGRLRLHDLQYDYVRKRAGSITELHRRLVEAYSAAYPSGLPSGPDDGYFFDHIGEHLVGAGRGEDLRRLLVDFDWLRAKLRATDPAALLGDFGLIALGDVEALMEGALRLSAHVLAIDKGQLASQLLGRLLDEDDERVQALLGSAARPSACPCMKPRTASLTHPGGALRCTLAGHSDGVNAAAVTLDGRYAVSASDDTTLKVWELKTGREARALEGHSGSVNAVAVTPDGRYAVSGSSDATLRVWEIETGRVVRVLARHKSSVKAVAVTPDGRYAVSGSYDMRLKVWEIETGREVHTLAGHLGAVNTVAVTPDGRYAVSGSHDTTLRVWDLSTGREVRELAGHSGSVNVVAVTPDGRYAVSGSDDDTLKVWELKTGRRVRELKGHLRSVNAVAVTPDSRHVVSGSDDETLKVWELKTGREVRSLAGHSFGVNAVAVAPDGKYAVSASNDQTLKVWALSTGRAVRAIGGHSGWVNAVAMTPDGRYAVSGSHDQTLRVWDIETGAAMVTFYGEQSFHCVAVSLDGRTVSAGDATGRVHFLSLEGLP